MNKALLAKLGWNLATNADKRLVKVLNSKYCKNENFMVTKIKGKGETLVYGKEFTMLGHSEERNMLSDWECTKHQSVEGSMATPYGKSQAY